MLLYGEVFALYWSGFWYCTAVCCSLCSQYLIGTSLDFVVVYRGRCNFVERRENRTIRFSCHQFSLKFPFLACDLFYLRICVLYFVPCTLHYTLTCVLHAAYFLSSSSLAPRSFSPAPFVHSYFVIV